MKKYETDAPYLYMIEFHEGFSVFSLDDSGEVVSNDAEKASHIDWVWADDDVEVQEYIAGQLEMMEDLSPVYAYRRANQYELSAYIEGEVDGSMTASIREAREHFNGVTWKMHHFDITRFETQKGFECGRCSEWFDFEEHAAKLGDMYLALTPDKENTVLWYVCKGCV